MRRGYIDRSVGKARKLGDNRVSGSTGEAEGDGGGGGDGRNTNDDPAAISSGVVKVLRVHERAREVDPDAPPTYLMKGDLPGEVS